MFEVTGCNLMVALDVTEGSLMKVVMMRWWGTLIR